MIPIFKKMTPWSMLLTISLFLRALSTAWSLQIFFANGWVKYKVLETVTAMNVFRQKTIDSTLWLTNSWEWVEFMASFTCSRLWLISCISGEHKFQIHWHWHGKALYLHAQGHWSLTTIGYFTVPPHTLLEIFFHSAFGLSRSSSLSSGNKTVYRDNHKKVRTKHKYGCSSLQVLFC